MFLFIAFLVVAEYVCIYSVGEDKELKNARYKEIVPGDYPKYTFRGIYDR